VVFFVHNAIFDLRSDVDEPLHDFITMGFINRSDSKKVWILMLNNYQQFPMSPVPYSSNSSSQDDGRVSYYPMQPDSYQASNPFTNQISENNNQKTSWYVALGLIGTVASIMLYARFRGRVKTNPIHSDEKAVLRLKTSKFRENSRTHNKDVDSTEKKGIKERFTDIMDFFFLDWEDEIIDDLTDRYLDSKIKSIRNIKRPNNKQRV
jgi:hypothetical protein